MPEDGPARSVAFRPGASRPKVMHPCPLRAGEAGGLRLEQRVVIVGAGIGGLSAAIALASRGVPVTIVERASRPGGKMREVPVAGTMVDGGPTVFTMRWVFEELL